MIDKVKGEGVANGMRGERERREGSIYWVKF